MGWREHGPPEVDQDRVRAIADRVYQIACHLDDNVPVPQVWVVELEHGTGEAWPADRLETLRGVPNEDAAAATVRRWLRGEAPGLDGDDRDLEELVAELQKGAFVRPEDVRWWVDALARTTGDPWFPDLIYAPLRKMTPTEVLSVARARGTGARVEPRGFAKWVTDASPAGPGQPHALPPNTMFRFRKLKRSRGFPSDGDPDAVIAFARDEGWNEDDLRSLEDAAQLWRMAY